VSYLREIDEALETIKSLHRYRDLPSHQPTGVIDFSSNDYLGLATDPQVLQAFKYATRVGSGGARLLGGRHREHSLLEEELAAWLGRERALLFSSGYMAALGAISVLAGCVDTIYSDRLNHASLIDSIRTRKTPRVIFEHGKTPSARERSERALIVTESIFSMDGDAVDIEAIAGDLRDGDILLVDEAHALGVAGPQGAGLARALDDPRIVIMGTLSKSFGAQGGFIAGPAALIELLVNAARTFIFDTALPPAVALAARVALTVMRRDDGLRSRLFENVKRLRAGLRSLGLAAIDDRSPIVPVIIGDEERALRVSACLLEQRLYVPAVRPPTVPVGTSRLRCSLRADHAVEHIDLLVQGLSQCIAIL
jgi:8-amino-7-oxononanoate synthase